MAEVRRRSHFEPTTLPGAGWNLRCPSCRERSPSLGDTLCPRCGERMAEDLPAVLAPPEPLAPWQQRQVLGPLSVGVALSPGLGAVALTLLTGGGMEAFWVFSILAGFLCLATVPLGVGLWRSVYNPAPTRTFSSRMPLKQAWFEITRHRDRRGLLVHVSFLAHGFVGRRLEVVVRFRGPDGYYLRSTLRNYRGDLGELRARHLTDPVKHGLAAFRNLWLFLPMRSLALPAGVEEVRLTAEILLCCDGVVHTEHDLPIEFRPLAEDFPHQLPAGPAAGILVDATPVSSEELMIVGPVPAGEAAACGTCGDPLSVDVVRCTLCDSAQHRECWEYVGGCTTYACEGRPSNPGS